MTPLRLSPRQLQIAQLVAEAYSNRQIAQQLGLAEQTVRNHLYRLCAKLGIHTRMELALMLIRGQIGGDGHAQG